MRAITHLHTRYSYDCGTRVSALLRTLDELDIDLALINDHDTFDGSLTARRIARERGLPIQIPVAAEIKTEFGDVIVVFPSEDVPPISELKQWSSLETLARGAGALIWLPHPYAAHQEVELLAAGADVIEVFNSRCKPEDNERAAELCHRHGKSPAYGADFHLRREVQWFVDYADAGDPLDVLRNPARCAQPTLARQSDVAASRCIAALRRRKPAFIVATVRRYLEARARERTAGRA